MSEMFLADAAVRVRADTALFRTQLLAGVSAAVKEAEAIAKIRVGAVGAAAIGAGTAAGISKTTTNATAATTSVNKLAGATNLLGAAQTREATAARIAEGANLKLASAERQHVSVLGSSITRRNEAIKGVQAQTLSMVGLRGAIIGANPAFLAATASAILFGNALQSATSFETQLNVFGVTAGATADQMARVGEQARKLGADVTLPGVSAGDAAEAMTELAKAGLSVEDSIAGARGVLQLATAAQIDNAQATELAASALNAFGLAGDQAVRVADVLANSANDAQGSITDIGQALQQASAIGRQAGLSLEQVTAVLTVFARNGLRGSDAGTAFRTMLTRLINPTTKAAAIIKDLGLNLRTSTGAINLGIFDQFTQATKNLTKAERDRDIAIIAGQDAFRGFSIATREGNDAINEEIASLAKAGAAADLAAARNVGLAGSTANLKNQLDNLGISIGNIAKGPLKLYVDQLSNIVGLSSSAITATGDLGDKFAELGSKIPGEGKITGLLKAILGSGITTPLAPLVIPIETKKAIDDLRELKGNAEQVGAEVRKIFAESGGGDLGLNVAINRLDDLAKKLEGGDKEAQKLGKTVQTVANQLRAAAQQGAVFPLASIKIPPELLAGTPGKTVAVKTKEAFAKELAGPALFNITVRGFRQLTPAIETAGNEAVAAAARVAQRIKTAISQATGQAAGFDEKINDALIAGSKTQELAALRGKAATQQKIIDTIGVGATDARLKALREAKAELAQITGQIKSVQDSITANQEQAAADAKQRASEIQAAQAKADQAVVDAFAPAQNRIDLAQISANATERLSDDIAVQKLIANTASREIAIIEKSVKDVQSRNSQIAARVKILKAAATELDSLRKQAADAATQKAQQARDLVTERLGKKLQLAQIIGNKDPILAAFNALIANERKNLAAAKKADKLDALIALQQTIKDRNDFIKGISKDAADGAKQATTAFDLLKQFTDVFNQNAGNLIGPNQPFAGPTGFTADIAQFLVRRPQRPQTPAERFPGKAADNVLVGPINDLATALRENTAAQKGNASTTKGVSTIARGHGLGRTFVDSNQVRQSIEARSGI